VGSPVRQGQAPLRDRDPKGTSTLAHLRSILWSLVALAAVALYLTPASPLRAQKVGASGGAFELTDQTGKRFSSAALAGLPYALFFGFTHCPDICPTTLVEMSNHLAALGPDADRLKVVFITVDPERDTPEHLRAYLASFDARIVGLTGSEAEITVAAKGWNAHHQKFFESDGTTTIVHSAYVYLMDADNRLAGTLNFQEPEAEQLAKLKALVAGTR
jgi:protein SCO1/2